MVCIPIPETAAHGSDSSDSIAYRFKDASIDALGRQSFDNALIFNFHQTILDLPSRHYTRASDLSTAPPHFHRDTQRPQSIHRHLHHDARRQWRTLPPRRQGAVLARTSPSFPGHEGGEAFRPAIQKGSSGRSLYRNGNHTATQRTTPRHRLSGAIFAHFGDKTQTRAPNHLRGYSAGQQPQSEWVTEDGRWITTVSGCQLSTSRRAFYASTADDSDTPPTFVVQSTSPDRVRTTTTRVSH